MTHETVGGGAPLVSAGVSGREGLRFVECSDVDPATFADFYHDVLRPAFPPEELNDFELLRRDYLESMPRPPGLIALLGDVPVGGALGEYYADSGILLLGYLAVRQDRRALGVGGSVIAEALSRWRESLDPTAIVAEIEDPKFHPPTTYGDPGRRVRFYDRLGAKLLPLQYFQPSLGPTLPRVRNMLLICLDGDRDSIPASVLSSFLDQYVDSCEGDGTSGNDPEYLSLRNQVTVWHDNVPLTPLPNEQGGSVG